MKSKIYLVSIMAFSLGLTLTAQTTKSSSEQQLTSNSSDNKRTLTRVGGKTVPDNLNAENAVDIKSAAISGENERHELLKLAEALSYQARRLRNDASAKSGNEKDKMLLEAEQFEKNSLLKQIKASEILGTICQVKFNSNKESIKKLMNTAKAEDTIMPRTRSLIAASEKNMQDAKMLREESDANSNLSAKLFGMSAAEEKEIQAISDQSKAIELLWKK